MIQIATVIAPSGGGKTHALVQHAVQLASMGEKVIISQVSVKLLRQTFKDIRSLSSKIPVEAIYHGTHAQVAPAILHKMQEAVPNEGEIILITHEALKRMGHSHREFWNLVTDEAISVFQDRQLKLAKTHSVLTDHLQVEELNDTYYAVRAKDRKALEGIAKNPTDDTVLKLFAAIAADILSDDYLVSVAKKSWDDLIANPETKGSINFFSVLKETLFSGFKSATLMSARLDETPQFMIWERIGNVEFVEHKALTSKLRYHQHTNGHRITFRYMVEHDWTRKLADQQLSSFPGDLKSALAEIAENHFSGKTFVWLGNKAGSGDEALFDDLNMQLPANSHGLNSYQHIHNAVVIPAFRYTSQGIHFLAALGITPEQSNVGLYFNALYQAIMRTSIRDLNATAPVEIVVADRAAAEWLSQVFPGSRVEHIGTKIPVYRAPKAPGRDKVHVNAAEKQRAYRERKKLEKAASAAVLKEVEQVSEAVPQEKPEPVPVRPNAILEDLAGRITLKRLEGKPDLGTDFFSKRE